MNSLQKLLFQMNFQSEPLPIGVIFDLERGTILDYKRITWSQKGKTV